MRGKALVSVAYSGIVVASLLLRSAVPVYALVPSLHDDLLFVRLAYLLGSGAWLGPYDQLTLIKGPGYPFFILGAFAAGIPLKIAEQILYLGACGLTAWLVWHLTKSRWLPLLLFGCLAFNPVMWNSSLARVIREGAYIGLSLAVVALAALLLLAPQAIRSAWARIVLLVTLGLLAAFYWLTREEGVWLVPALGVLATVGGLGVWRERRAGDARERSGSWLAIAGLAAIPITVFAAGLSVVAGLNARYYGAFMLNEFQSGPFPRAYGALSRIEHAEWKRYVPVSDDALQKAYSVSAVARELQPSLDGRLGESWRRMGCENARLDPCPGIHGGWLMWALREAVAAAGHYSSPGDARAFYERLAAEINAACDAGRIACTAPRATMMPVFRWHYVGDALGVFPELGRILTTFGNGEVGAPPSIGDEFRLGLFRDLVGPLSREPTSTVVLLGSVTEKGAPAQLSVRDRDGVPSRTELKLSRPASPSPAAMEFELTTDCVRPSCELVASSGSYERTFPIADIKVGLLISSEHLDIAVRQSLGRGASSMFPVASEMRRDLLLGIARGIARTYAAVMPVLGAVAVLGILIALAMSRSVPWPPGLMALVVACATAVAARMGLLAYLEVTSIPSANLLYLSPVTPLLLTFIVLGLYLGIRPLPLPWPWAREREAAEQ
jgi:hypothetical protein